MPTVKGAQQMPTTLTGLLIFVVLLLPGFAYLVGKERHGTERHTSPFRETVAIVAASATSELAILGLFAAARAIFPSRTPDVGALIRPGANAYTVSHYRSLATLGLILLCASVGLAYLATVPWMRRLFSADFRAALLTVAYCSGCDYATVCMCRVLVPAVYRV